jgi:hypothetical protein
LRHSGDAHPSRPASVRAAIIVNWAVLLHAAQLQLSSPAV